MAFLSEYADEMYSQSCRRLMYKSAAFTLMLADVCL